MTNEEKLLQRLTTIAQIMAEWAQEDTKSCEKWEQNDYHSLAQWYKGKSQAFKMASDWILESIGKK